MGVWVPFGLGIRYMASISIPQRQGPVACIAIDEVGTVDHYLHQNTLEVIALK